jgi:hypothetical protein
MTVFWDVAPCSLVKIDRRFRGAYWLHNQNGSCKHIWNFGQFTPDYAAQRHTRSRESLRYQPNIFILFLIGVFADRPSLINDTV